ncbi:MAG: hypothetical protein M1822_002612 [Bathelium mastoideum]|nr:MAG: hypothetical protein M1822_002612 [Bathelium mastoideum]
MGHASDDALSRSSGSVSSRSTKSSRKPLFGEIESVTSLSSGSVASVCNIILSGSSAFTRFWLSDNCRDSLLSCFDKSDSANFRLVCHDFGVRAAATLFEDVNVTFKSSTFTKPARIAALERVGHHVRTFAFNLPHSAQTFLPPLVDPSTGEERVLTYVPQVPGTEPVKTKEPKFGSWELADLVIKQYPPLFHAATNVPSFVRAFSAMPFLKHVKVSCPGQDVSERDRRSVVDYALVSLRIAIERAHLLALHSLTLSPIHPAGLFYLKPMLNYGTTPGSGRRWAQIQRLSIQLDSFKVDGKASRDHLKVVHTYLRCFSPSLTHCSFRWNGRRGLDPFTLDTEACIQPEATEHPLARSRRIAPLRFPKLQNMELENAAMDAVQISSFLTRHRRTIADVMFENVHLRSGTWDDALAPLTQISGNDEWKKKQEEVMDVPIMYSPVDPEPIKVNCLPVPSQQPQRARMSFGRLFMGGKGVTLPPKPKEQPKQQPKQQPKAGAEHMRKLLKTSVFSWR